MKDTTPTSGGFPAAAALLLALWVIGLAQSTRVTLATTGHDDIFADLAQFEALARILGDASVAGLRTDLATNQATSNRRWRFQYVAQPTIVQPLYTDEAVYGMARSETLETGSFHLIYDYRGRRNYRAFDRAFRDFAASVGCEVAAVDLARRTVVYRLHDCADD